jgi:hypothetical protein
MVIVGTQESSSETSFIDVLERDVLGPRYFQRQRTVRKKIQSSFDQHLIRAARIIAENATWMFCAYKTPRIYLYLFQDPGSGTKSMPGQIQIQQYKCLRPCGFTMESGNIWKGANFLKIQFGLTTLFVVNTHLFYASNTEDHGLALREEQFKKIIEWIVQMYNNNENFIIVFMGDLNFRMKYPDYDNAETSYQQFIQRQSKKITHKNDELYTFLSREKKNSTPTYKKIIQGLLNDIPEKPPLTCKRKSQQQDDNQQEKKKFQEKFQIRVDKKTGAAPLPSKERKPSNCDKILIHTTFNILSSPFHALSSPIQTFKVKNTDHCGVYRTLSILKMI